MPAPEDPVLRNARREAKIILAVWASAMVYCCLYSYFFGYIREGHPRGMMDVQPILGVPSWFFWGVLAPWGVVGIITIGFAAFVMTDDDLGSDHTMELDEEIREEGAQHG